MRGTQLNLRHTQERARGVILKMGGKTHPACGRDRVRVSRGGRAGPPWTGGAAAKSRMDSSLNFQVFLLYTHHLLSLHLTSPDMVGSLTVTTRRGKVGPQACNVPAVDLPSASPALLSSDAHRAMVGRWRLIARSLHRNADLSTAEVRALRRQIADLNRLVVRWDRAGEAVEEVVVAPGVTVRRRAARRFPSQNWMFDPRSRGKCPACRGQLPHVTFAERKHHNLMCAVKIPGLKKVWARIRAGTLRPWEVSNANRQRDGLARRAAVFAAEVPHVARVLGEEKVRAIVSGYSPRHGYAQFRGWVRVHYGVGRKRRTVWPATARDPVTGRWMRSP